MAGCRGKHDMVWNFLFVAQSRGYGELGASGGLTRFWGPDDLGCSMEDGGPNGGLRWRGLKGEFLRRDQAFDG
jgi:hypothetical protein